MKISNVLFVLFCLFASISYAQVKMGGSPLSISPASLLELESDSQGVLLPRLTNAQRDAQTNWVSGHIIYSIEDSCFQFYDGNVWECMVSSSQLTEATESAPLPPGFGGGAFAAPNGSITTFPNRGNGVACTSDGGYILFLNVNYGWLGIAEKFPYNGGSNDMIVVKLDASLNISWRKHFGSLDSDIARCIFQTQDGGYIIGGNYANVLKLPSHYLNDPNTLISPTQLVSGFVLKMDSLGNQLWVNKTPPGLASSSAFVWPLAGVELNDGSGFLMALEERIAGPTYYRGIGQYDSNGNIVGTINDNLNGRYYQFIATPWGYLALGIAGSSAVILGINNDLSIRFNTTVSTSELVSMRLLEDNGDFYILDRTGTNLQIRKYNSSNNSLWSRTYTGVDAMIVSKLLSGYVDASSNLILAVHAAGGTLFSEAVLAGTHEWIIEVDGSNGDILNVADSPYGSEYVIYTTAEIFPFQLDKTIGVNVLVGGVNTPTTMGIETQPQNFIWIFTMDSDMNLEENRIIFDGN